MSSDDEEDVPPKATNQVSEVTVEQPISEEEYRRMLRKHRKRRMRSKVRVQWIKHLILCSWKVGRDFYNMGDLVNSV